MVFRWALHGLAFLLIEVRAFLQTSGTHFRIGFEVRESMTVIKYRISLVNMPATDIKMLKLDRNKHLREKTSKIANPLPMETEK